MSKIDLGKYRDAGLLILRVGLGIAMMAHGWPKLIGGPNAWSGLGQAGGFYFVPVFWGFLAACIEVFGGILFAVGFFFRLTSLLLMLQMCAALMFHVRRGDEFKTYSHALELAIVFAAMILIGAGRYSADRR